MRRRWQGIFCGVLSVWLSGCNKHASPPASPAQNPTPPADEIVYVEKRGFLESEDDYYLPDPLVGHLHRPGARRSYKWKGHPRGEVVLQTNNMGFREDHDTVTEGREGLVTILVTGDSHTDGVVWNDESFPNLLESGLAQRFPSVRFDVINGGVGYYGPYNYPRFIEKYAVLAPKLVIVNFYTGNDFQDACQVLESAGLANERGSDYYSRLNALPKRLRQVAGQHLNQAFYLSIFPTMQPAALDYTEKQLGRLADYCRAHEIELLILLQPDKLEVEADPSVYAEAATALELEVEQLHVGRRLSLELAARLEQRGVAVVDLLPMLAGNKDLFWPPDHHVNNVGHRKVAEFLLEHEGERFVKLGSQP